MHGSSGQGGIDAQKAVLVKDMAQNLSIDPWNRDMGDKTENKKDEQREQDLAAKGWRLPNVMQILEHGSWLRG